MAGVFGIDSNRRFDQNCFLCSHNAYAARSYGWIYYEQRSKIYKQLRAGARALMLDIWVRENEIYLIHDGIAPTLCFKPFSEPTKLKDVFQEIRKFLDVNPKEVVSCFFESYVHNPRLMKNAMKEGNVEDIIFWQNGHHGGVDVTLENQGWPTLKEMVAMNKRLVLFSDLCNSDGLPFEWNYCTENCYGQKGIDKRTWAHSRCAKFPLSCRNTLFLMNHFPSFSCGAIERITQRMAKLNNKDLILEHARACREAVRRHCSEMQNRVPNFVAIDEINRGKNGGGKAAVQEINQWWADIANRDRVLDTDQRQVGAAPAGSS